ncbi:antibiotic biosynthesis monooxygenase [Pseudomonas sp. ZM23]|uniref:Antibiotic biosynthesis monooxygenase n=1 Tax=Pseudomonas triclosanedens TaxID=2961893 RepID=A0ABY7A6R5_9PSED|nr:antibiotic biosynthesis monooxygenase [Pseudomonas triclosanedens]MCP8465795.1 antibiotic biosynthesis monooxygenase [Pseudomonas triclosanedens]MCP8471290.1 antibiotic biosynthesis monooxygenase [Pseudomonas triclosanedens]MCP8477094.1 antibiotic biosynthesis monooxygenase [Pseudomonas triclosanedens]WAI51798.1 antibiotic biosynthesis monooxygenase [Pseudomonas triclosanedens]
MTPQPPYYAVIFTSRRSEIDSGYADTAERMLELAARQDGFLGVESARGADGLGITVSYWRDETAIAAWRAQFEHRQARQRGRQEWYDAFDVRVSRVERAYAFRRDGDSGSQRLAIDASTQATPTS